MKIVAHRGLWQKNSEQNTMLAFQNASRFSYGCELDVRDFKGKLVVHHDVPRETNSPLLLSELLQYWSETNPSLPLFFDIKSSGLVSDLQELVRNFALPNFCVFGTSVQDLVQYEKSKIPFLSRWSEREHKLSLNKKSSGICIDSFYGDWFDSSEIEWASKRSDIVLIISPELHGRTHLEVWHLLKETEVQLGLSNLALCTDLCHEARALFEKSQSISSSSPSS